MSNDDVTMSHDDISATTGDPFDGIDTASEITEQTGVVSEFTMEKEAANQVATGIEEAIKEDEVVTGEAGEKAASVKLSPEELKARAQKMAGQAKAVSSRVIESAKSYEQVRKRIYWAHMQICLCIVNSGLIDRSWRGSCFETELIPGINLCTHIISHTWFLPFCSTGASPRRQGEGQGPAGQGLRGRQGASMHISRRQGRRGRGCHRRHGGCQGVSEEIRWA